MITLTHPAEGVLTLPDQLEWPDEFAWKQVEQTTTYTTTGALLIEAAAKQAGRPITLQGSETRAWCTRGALVTLRAWAATPGQALTLALRGANYDVVFDHAGGALSATPIVDFSDPDTDDWYFITLRFLET